MNWQPIETLPASNGTYLVANSVYGFVLTARYQRRKNVFTFASAQQRFPITHWMPLPDAPKP